MLCWWPETVQDVGVVGVEVGGQGAAQLPGEAHGGVGGVVDPRPGGEHGARHEDDAVEVRLPDHGAVHQVLHAGRAHSLHNRHVSYVFWGSN